MASSGDAACQLSSAFANVPFTRTTGSGCADVCWQPKLSAPGGGVCGEVKPAHPQTVRYRLRQIQELFGDQLRDQDRRFELQLALRIRTLAGRRDG